MLNEGPETIRQGWCGGTRMVGLRQGWIFHVWPIWDADGVGCVHGAIEHTHFIYDGSLQVRKLFHQRNRLVELQLEVSVPTQLW